MRVPETRHSPVQILANLPPLDQHLAHRQLNVRVGYRIGRIALKTVILGVLRTPPAADCTKSARPGGELLVAGKRMSIDHAACIIKRLSRCPLISGP